MTLDYYLCGMLYMGANTSVFWEPLTCSWKGTFFTVGPPGLANTATAELLAELNRERVHTLLSCSDKPIAGPFLFNDHGIINCSKKGRMMLKFT